MGTAFTASTTAHGGQESTILALNNTLYHWGMLILPLGYTASEVFNAGGNPYSTSYTSGKSIEGPDTKALAVARNQGQRLARYAVVIASRRVTRASAARAFCVRNSLLRARHLYRQWNFAVRERRPCT